MNWEEEILLQKRKKILIARVFGGIGNQLFIYAAARRISLVHDLELVLDDVSGFAYDKEYKRNYQLGHFNITSRNANKSERMEPLSRFRRMVIKKWNSMKPYEKRNYLVQEGIDYDSRLLYWNPKGNRVYLEGYWQSEKYFQDIENQIRQDLRIKPPTDKINLDLFKKIQLKPSVALHVRFFEDPSKSANSVINKGSSDYYSKAIKKMEGLVRGAHYYVFSDKPDLARDYIPLSDDRVSIITNNKGDKNAYADLWLMSKCNHFIIANSTFSWWGAWLASTKNKIVIAPGFEMRHGKSAWGFNGLLPSSWLKI